MGCPSGAGGFVKYSKSNIARLLGDLVGAFSFVLGILATHATMAAPLDLADPTPRWIEVRFEVSPAAEPGSLDVRWSEPRRAQIELVHETGALRIRIPADEVEAQFRSTGSEPIQGTFSDFVWLIDPVTGHVLTADLSGLVQRTIKLGPFSKAARVSIQVEMTTTEQAAGFVPGQGIFGIPTNPFCSPETSGDDGHVDRHGDAGCVAVKPIRFDPARGYVNAVGSVRAGNAFAEIRNFSPLGEVKFLETAPSIIESAVSGSSQAEALCSQSLGRPCLADPGGES
jgi:hypothetical protein